MATKHEISLVLCFFLGVFIIWCFMHQPVTPEPPPTSPIRDIEKIIQYTSSRDRRMPYDIITIDSVTKKLITRRRWFDEVVADAKPDEKPWAVIKTKQRENGAGNVLHIHSAFELDVHAEKELK